MKIKKLFMSVLLVVIISISVATQCFADLQTISQNIKAAWQSYGGTSGLGNTVGFSNIVGPNYYYGDVTYEYGKLSEANNDPVYFTPLASTNAKYAASLNRDFGYRDTLYSTANVKALAPTFPKFNVMSGYNYWSRDRIIAVADKYAGWVTYSSVGNHIPSTAGMDCSNFTSWVYNYAGIKKFGTTVSTQAQEILNCAGTSKITDWNQLKKGDLIYIHNDCDPAYALTATITHAAIFISLNADGTSTVIDCTSGRNGVGRRTVPASGTGTDGWYRSARRFSYGVRVIPNS